VSRSGDGFGCIGPRLCRARVFAVRRLASKNDGGDLRPPLCRPMDSARDRLVRGDNGAVGRSTRLGLSMDFGAPIFSLSAESGGGMASASVSKEGGRSESGTR
jgi:hypothetical protein